jgi:hypothetical protein
MLLSTLTREGDSTIDGPVIIYSLCYLISSFAFSTSITLSLTEEVKNGLTSSTSLKSFKRDTYSYNNWSFLSSYQDKMGKAFSG